MSVSVEELAYHADAALAALTQRRTFEEARAALNEAGMLRARQRLVDALATIEAAQAKVRAAQELAALRKTALDQALAEAEWELDGRFVSEGNKTFLVVGDERKQMTADERKTWKQTEARKLGTVVHAAATHAGAESNLNASRDALTHAELAFRAARADLDAAIATVSLFAQSLKKETQP